MILNDNIVFELQHVGGVSKYWSKTIARLDDSERDIAFLEGPDVMENIFRAEMVLTKPIMVERGRPALRRFTGSKSRAEVFHSSYYRISRRARANVLTIHDFMNEMFPSSFRDPILAQLKKRACRHATAIAVVSQRTKLDLLRHYPFVDPGRVHVTYNGVDDEFYPEVFSATFAAGPETLIPRGYFLYVGTRGHCKNFPYVLKILSEARSSGLELPLIMVGGGPLLEAEWVLAEAQGLPRDTIRHIHGLPDTTLRRLYSNCTALLIPSIYEGFGLPAAEAARCGALVLTARGSALDEIVGETDFAFDLCRKGEPARVLTLGLDSAAAEAERVRIQRRSAMFDWDASAARLMEIYDGL